MPKKANVRTSIGAAVRSTALPGGAYPIGAIFATEGERWLADWSAPERSLGAQQHSEWGAPRPAGGDGGGDVADHEDGQHQGQHDERRGERSGHQAETETRAAGIRAPGAAAVDGAGTLRPLVPPPRSGGATGGVAG